MRFSGSGCPCRRGEALPGKREKAYCAGRVLFHRSAAAAMAGESALRGVCHFHRYARAVMAGEKRRRDACPARGNWLLESGRGRITSSAPFLQARRRCHGGRKRVARSLSFSQACALSWWEKNDEGMSARHGEAGEGVLRRARPFSQVCALSWWEKSAEWMSVQRMETLPEKREKARCAGHVLFHRRATVVIAGERCRRDVYPARRNGFRKSGRKCAALSAPFLQARRRCHSGGKARCAEFVLFTGTSPLSWRGKSAKGIPFRRREALLEKRERARCAGHVLFTGVPPLS